MASNLLPLSILGAVETNGTVSFGFWLPWVSAVDGNAVTVKIIHEHDQFLQEIPPREFPMAHSVRSPYGDFWSATVPIVGTTPANPGSAWGTAGRYVYRYQINNPNVGILDWIIDPCAREFGVGKLSAFTLGYQPYNWSVAEANWRTPELSNLIIYEINIAELGGDLERTRDLMVYLSDLGVNAIEIMPLSNVAMSVSIGDISPSAISALMNDSVSALTSRNSLILLISKASPSLSTSYMVIPESIFPTTTLTIACSITKTLLWDLSPKIISAALERARALGAHSHATIFSRLTIIGSRFITSTGCATIACRITGMGHSVWDMQTLSMRLTNSPKTRLRKISAIGIVSTRVQARRSGSFNMPSN
ncbi:hypothetical protein SAMN05216318_1125 [Nitrosomonas eutropha]|nr:hypothetical protein SAMN05216318_1125 [Nitrosomonas eutropha]